MSILDEFLSDEAKQGDIEKHLAEECVFTTGEILLIRGAFFKVKARTQNRLYLDFVGIAKDILKKPSGQTHVP